MLARLKGKDMTAYKLETTFRQDGILMLENLPFSAGNCVEIIILRKPEESLEELEEQVANYYLSMSEEDKKEDNQWIGFATKSLLWEK